MKWSDLLKLIDEQVALRVTRGSPMFNFFLEKGTCIIKKLLAIIVLVMVA